MQCTNLTDILKERKELSDVGVTFIEGANQESFLSYKDLYHAALRALGAIQHAGIRPQEELLIQIDSNRNFIIVFWACILGGIIPVPLSIGQNDNHRRKLFNVWSVLRRPHLIISSYHFDKLAEFARQNSMESTFSAIAENVIEEDAVFLHTDEGNIFDTKSDAVAFVQFSSGSTGHPKGVILTHANLLANMDAIRKAAGYSPEDIMMSWMPLTHDMGLIGFHLNPLYCGMNHYLIPTNLFIRRPSLWLEKASEHKASIICSPNFGYEYVMRHCNDDTGYNWDLSQVRILYNGAEPISENICHDFLGKMSRYGLRKQAMCPVYGLAEASLAVSISGVEDEVMAIHLNRNEMNAGSKVSAKSKAAHTASFVNVGKPVHGCSVRIVDEHDAALEPERIGHIQIKGDNVTSGYYNNEAATRDATTKDGWVRTGDLGLFRAGALYITGRAKDIIFVNGVNYYPHDLEQIAEEVEGIELNKVAIAGFFNEDTQQEAVIAFVFHRGDLSVFVPVAQSLSAVINARIGFEVDWIIPVRHIPRTTSGKLQRFRLLEQFKNGSFSETLLALEQLMKPAGSVNQDVQNEREEKLLAIWKKVLNKNNISVNDAFFEIGGNSLKAAEMAMELLKEFQVELPINTFYRKQTIRELSEEIENLQVKAYIPIVGSPEMSFYPVSAAQRRIYYYWEINRSGTGYNIPVAFRIKGSLDAAKLEYCIKQLVRRHDSLRTSFHMQEEPKFKVHPAADFVLNSIECGRSDRDEQLKYLIQPFDLAKAPLFRAALLRSAHDEYLLFIDFHHIIADGYAVFHFVQELMELYIGNELPALTVQYKDYVSWEAAELQSERIKQQEAYWTNQFQEELPVLEMPLDFQRPSLFDTEGQKISFEIETETVAQLRNLAQTNDTSLHVLLLTIYAVLLSKYTGQKEMIIGIPVAGRRHPDLYNMQGMFVNNLAIRNDITGEETFTELLAGQKRRVEDALYNQDYPFDSLVQLVAGKTDAGRNPLFDSMFNYQNMGIPVVEGLPFDFSRYDFDPGFAKFDISLEIFENDNALTGGFEYATTLFRRETILRLVQHFINLTHRVISSPDCRVSDLQVISADEQDEYTRQFNATAYDYPGDKCIHQLFDEQVRRTPGEIAIACDDRTLTYGELGLKTDQLAALLRTKSIAPGVVVAVWLNRSPELIISILGILKAGGAFLPIDPELPEERVRFLVDNSKCRLIIAEKEFAANNRHIGASEVEMLHIDLPGQEMEKGYERENGNTSLDLAYIIYTSGTTGLPKGVMIEHRSLVNYITWAARNYIKAGKAVFPLYTSISFDLTITSIFTPLITGNQIIIYPQDEKEFLVERVIRENKANIIKVTPSHLNALKERLSPDVTGGSGVSTFIVGGEDLSTPLAQDIFDRFGKKVDIYNEYGPTEATVGCMIYKFREGDGLASVPIGKPADNTQIYILDESLKPVPAGVHGEIYISGEGLSRGYLFNEALTKEKFIANPFIDGARMYRTGDRAKRLPDGHILYLGRLDKQVKVNGYRIELAEIEHHLSGHRHIAAALVVVGRNKNGQKTLYAYYKPSEDSKDMVREAELRSYLAGRLPHFMVPGFFIPIDHIPLTKNGKIDYNALPVPEQDVTKARADKQPANEIEQLLLNIWKEVLNEPEISVADNFFELGGDSIKAVQIVSRLANHGISLSVKEILVYQSIAQIASYAAIAMVNNHYEQGIVQGEIALYPIISWFFQKGFKNEGYYNQSVLLELNRKIDIMLLEAAFKRLITQHDGLRINYHRDRNVLFYNSRYVNEKFTVDVYNLEPGDNRNAHLTKICEEVRSGFDIEQTCLIKACVIKEAGNAALLFITAHHFLVDGMSWRILLEDLYTIYNALEKQEEPKIPLKTAALKDWSSQLLAYSKNSYTGVQEAYWRMIDNTIFHLPLDFETDNWQIKHQQKVSGTLDKEISGFLLKDAHQTYKTDVPIILNTALALTLKEWTGQDQFIIEQESHGRLLSSIDVSRTTGWFTALYPVKLEIKEGGTGEQIKQIKQQLRSVADNGIDYGVYRYMKQSAGITGRSPAAIRLNYLGQFDKELMNDLFSYSNTPSGSEVDPENTMTARIEINGIAIGGILTLEISYNELAYKHSTINWLMSALLNNIKLLLNHIKGETDIHLTPSDFDAVDLSDEELNALFR